MLRVLIPALLIVLLIYALIDCVRTDHRDIRSLPKVAWLLVILLLPTLGAILWFFLGRPYDVVAPTHHAPRGPSAPDDDPDFLRQIEQRRRQQAEAERLKALEAEVKAREAAAKPPKKNQSQEKPDKS